MMRNRMFLLTAIILLSTHGMRAERTIGSEPRQETEGEIRRLEDRINRAIVEGDVAFFDRILAEEFTHTSQSGKFRTRAEWMKGREQGKSSYESFETEDAQVRIYADTAVVTGLSKAKWREADGQPRSGEYRFLRVWVRRDGRWQAVAFQSTAISGGGSRE